MARTDGREWDQLRPIELLPGFVRTAFGSCLASFGGTRVIVTASVEPGVPAFLKGKGQGWLTAEYAMLPASTGRRKARDGVKRDGRSIEISRLIGRSLRQAVDLRRLGDLTMAIDCDVLEADGGTRTAAITGGFVALCQAVDALVKDGRLKESPITGQVAAVSCGIVGGQAALDLCYEEDSGADADMNFVMNDKGGLIEVQGTGEGGAFSPDALREMLGLAEGGIRKLMAFQRVALGAMAAHIAPPRMLVAATANAHKLLELRQMLGKRFRVIGMQEAGFIGTIEETGSTFQDNAVLKAEAVRDATGLMSLADDSGLEVASLGGAPGVNSARYAGVHGDDRANNELLLKNMAGISDRAARFVSCLALAEPGRETRVVTGVCEGRLADSPRGSGGFGYDPLFEAAGGKTFAEMPEDEKNRISHRARAIALLMEALP